MCFQHSHNYTCSGSEKLNSGLKPRRPTAQEDLKACRTPWTLVAQDSRKQPDGPGKLLVSAAGIPEVFSAPPAR